MPQDKKKKKKKESWYSRPTNLEASASKIYNQNPNIANNDEGKSCSFFVRAKLKSTSVTVSAHGDSWTGVARTSRRTHGEQPGVVDDGRSISPPRGRFWGTERGLVCIYFFQSESSSIKRVCHWLGVVCLLRFTLGTGSGHIRFDIIIFKFDPNLKIISILFIISISNSN